LLRRELRPPAADTSCLPGASNPALVRSLNMDLSNFALINFRLGFDLVRRPKSARLEINGGLEILF
jgi:hypothetical protein